MASTRPTLCARPRLVLRVAVLHVLLALLLPCAHAAMSINIAASSRSSHRASNKQRRSNLSDGPAWPRIMASSKTLPPLAMHKFQDFPLPVDTVPSVFTPSLPKLCKCEMEGGEQSEPMFLNPGLAEYKGTLYVALLRRVMVRNAQLTYQKPEGPQTKKMAMMEGNDIVLCKAAPDFSSLDECDMVQADTAYEEAHPRRPKYELHGLNDPRLIVWGDSLFLQMGCRPAWNTHWFGETPCLMRLMGEDHGEWPLRVVVPVSERRPEAPWEKNWVAFAKRDGSVLWSRNLLPHNVVSLHADGRVVREYNSTSPEAFVHLQHVCGHGPRGNTPAVFLPANLSGAGQDFYLGVLHMAPDHGKETLNNPTYACAVYLNFWYLMETEPPYRIHEASMSPIPLVSKTNPYLDSPPVNQGMGYISFPTGLHISSEGHVYMTYGSGDLQARVFITSVRDVMMTFASGAQRLRTL